MDHTMHLTCVSFSYLSKVNLGGKVVHWTRTLSQDSGSLMSQCITPTFPPYFCLALTLNRPVKCAKDMQNTGEPMPKFFLVLDFKVQLFFY